MYIVEEQKLRVKMIITCKLGIKSEIQLSLEVSGKGKKRKFEI